MQIKLAKEETEEVLEWALTNSQSPYCIPMAKSMDLLGLKIAQTGATIIDLGSESEEEEDDDET